MCERKKKGGLQSLSKPILLSPEELESFRNALPLSSGDDAVTATSSEGESVKPSSEVHAMIASENQSITSGEIHKDPPSGDFRLVHPSDSGEIHKDFPSGDFRLVHPSDMFLDAVSDEPPCSRPAPTSAYLEEIAALGEAAADVESLTDAAPSQSSVRMGVGAEPVSFPALSREEPGERVLSGECVLSDVQADFRLVTEQEAGTRALDLRSWGMWMLIGLGIAVSCLVLVQVGQSILTGGNVRFSLQFLQQMERSAKQRKRPQVWSRPRSISRDRWRRMSAAERARIAKKARTAQLSSRPLARLAYQCPKEVPPQIWKHWSRKQQLRALKVFGYKPKRLPKVAAPRVKPAPK